MIGLQLHVGKAQSDKSRVTDTGIREEFQYDDMRELVGLPVRLVQGNEFGLHKEVLVYEAPEIAGDLGRWRVVFLYKLSLSWKFQLK